MVFKDCYNYYVLYFTTDWTTSVFHNLVPFQDYRIEVPVEDEDGEGNKPNLEVKHKLVDSKEKLVGYLYLYVFTLMVHWLA